MKYLFAAIDARQKLNSNSNTLKQLILDAGEGLDEKSSTHDFVDTLERIVGEIRNTTEHSTAFLQKVKKHEAPDYYSVIARPMDLATLLKRVKGQVYRTKKAFADDLDLIWSNCLSYNSHPAHPLRRSAEILRQKSNQLLEFITDPSQPARPSFTAKLTHNVDTPTSTSNSKRATPVPGGGDDEAEGEDEVDAENDSDDDDATAKNQQTGRSGMSLAGPAVTKLLMSENGDSRNRSASPVVSRSESQTPFGDRATTKKLVKLPVTDRSQSRDIKDFDLGAQVAIIRTPQSMQNFVNLDAELDRLDATLAYSSVASTSRLPATSALGPTLALARLDALVHSINPSVPIASSDVDLPLLTNESRTTAPSEQLWWDTIAAPGSTLALASGIPGTGFIAQGRRRKVAKASSTKKRESKGKGKESVQVVPKGQSQGLEKEMRHNLKVLQEIRRLHSQWEETEGIKVNDSASLRVEGQKKVPTQKLKKVKKAIPVPLIKARTKTLPLTESAASNGLSHQVATVLAHTGFEGVNAMASNVMTHVAAEYISNLGRTLRFYSDRYGGQMTSEQILLHVLGENGVESPSTLSYFISEDLYRYGTRLEKLRDQLRTARGSQVDAKGVVPGNRMTQVEEFSTVEENVSNELPFPLPPAFIPLTSSSIDLQIGLLQSVYRSRATTEFGLMDDAALDPPLKNTRAKVPLSGKIVLANGNGGGGKKRKSENNGLAMMSVNAGGSGMTVGGSKKRSRKKPEGLAE